MKPPTTPGAQARPDLAMLRASIRGPVLGPDDPGYEAARVVQSGAVDKRPGAIVRVSDAADVARVIAHARIDRR